MGILMYLARHMMAKGTMLFWRKLGSKFLKLIPAFAGMTFLFLSIVSCSGSLGLEEKVYEVKLSNGMTWFLVKRGYAPVFAGVLQVKVGGVDEQIGKTGIAHLLEHMSFKGTTTIGTSYFKKEKEIMNRIDRYAAVGRFDEVAKLAEEQKKYIVSNEIWRILTENGATNINAYTSKDLTTYHAEMPNSKLELWLYITSEMISDPAFREFYTERNVVLEELRSSIDNDPNGKLFQNLLETVFKRSSYSWPVIGNYNDVRELTRDDIKSFYEKHYTPECMTGAIVGDIDISGTKDLLEKYFGKLKKRNGKCERTLLLDPPQISTKEEKVEFNAEPILVMAYNKPTAPEYDDYVFDIFSTLLCDSESSRFEEILVKEKKLAKSISCFNSFPGTRLPDLFVIYAQPFSQKGIEELKKEITRQLDLLKNGDVKSEDLEKAKNQMKVSFLMGLDSNYGLAETLAYFYNVSGSWKYVVRHPDNLDKIGLDDLKQAAIRYFVPDNQTVIELVRK